LSRDGGICSAVVECSAVIGRLVRSEDFERVLRCAPRARTQHFAIHHLADRPSRAAKPADATKGELSTGGAPKASVVVDDSVPLLLSSTEMWLGAVVPKRHARRAVTRTMLKRQIRAALSAQAPRLGGGLWVIRLRAPFDKTIFSSATSTALEKAAAAELAQALRHAARSKPAV
jgi:ribonuclease P protein component